MLTQAVQGPPGIARIEKKTYNSGLVVRLVPEHNKSLSH
jgi:hypothetical protein